MKFFKFGLVLMITPLMAMSAGPKKKAQAPQPKLDPKTAEALKWMDASPTLEKVLKSQGWWKPSDKGESFPNTVVLVNKKQSQPATMIIRSRGIASLPAGPSLEEIGRRECVRIQSKNFRSKYEYNYDVKTESGSCWVYAPGPKLRTSEHSFLKIRSVFKGSKAFVLENSYLVTDNPVGKKVDPYKAGRQIAKSLGALP